MNVLEKIFPKKAVARPILREGNTAYQIFKSHAEPLYSPWLCDETFLEIAKRFPGYDPQETFWDGRYLQYKLARHALSLKGGDFMECGVYDGKCLDILASVLDQFDTQNRQLIGVDSFQGVDVPLACDKDIRDKSFFFQFGSMKGKDKASIENYLSYHKSTISLYQGWIPQPFETLQDKTFAFVHIDVDLYQATLDTLNFVYNKMVPGGVILIDDYGFPMCMGCRQAVDEFLSNKQEILLPTASAPAFFFKHL